MAQLIKNTAERKGDEMAIIDEAGELTWSDFNSRVNRVIHLLRSLGVQPGDTIAVMSGNRRELFEIGAAAIHSSLIFVPVNWHWVSRELSYVLGDSDAKVLFVEDQYGEVAREACRDPQADDCPHRIAIGDKEVPGFASYEQLIGQQESSEPEDQATGGPMFYTSGTTGFPKGVRGAINQTGNDIGIIELIALGAAATLRIPKDGVTLLDGPAYHSAQLALSLYPVLGLGSTCVMRQHFDAATLRAYSVRAAAEVKRRTETQLRRLVARVRHPWCGAVSGASEAIDDRMVGSGTDRILRWHRERLLNCDSWPRVARPPGQRRQIAGLLRSHDC